MMAHAFATGGPSVLATSRTPAFFDGTFTTRRLQHPEAAAVGPDACIWCGSENGQIQAQPPASFSNETR